MFPGADYSLLLEPEMGFRLLLLVALFVASAFFSGSETALFSLSRTDLRRLRREHSPHAETLHALLDQPRRLIISILCGNELVNVAAAANLTGILVRLYGVEHTAWISTVVMVPLLLLFGEATPKTIAVADPVGTSTRIVARPMDFWVNVISPVSSLIRIVADRVTSAFVGEEKGRANILQVDEFRMLVDEGVVSGELSATERALIHNLLRAGSAEIVEIMVPRTRMAAVDGGLPLPEVIDAFMAYRHNRVPVYLAHRDNIVGFLYSEDIMRLTLEKVDLARLTLEEVIRPPVMVPPTKKIDEMFDYFQRNDVQAVAVLNEFGGIDGLLTMNDVLTCIFGRTHDVSADSAVNYDPATGAYEVPGEMTLTDFAKLTNAVFEDSRMTTIAGVILRLVDRLPVVGDSVVVGDMLLEVAEMEDNRISRVRTSHDTARESEPVLDAGDSAVPRSSGQNR
jgi:CBS domain containing-hemolysin-like protein